MVGIKHAAGLTLWVTAVLGLPFHNKQPRAYCGFLFRHWSFSLTAHHTATSTKNSTGTVGDTIHSEGSQASAFSTSITPSRVSISLSANTASPGEASSLSATTQGYTVTSTFTSPSRSDSTTATPTDSSISSNLAKTPFLRANTRISTQNHTLTRGASRKSRKPSTTTLTSTKPTKSVGSQRTGDAIPFSAARTNLGAVKQLNESSSLPAYTNSQSGTPSGKPTADGALLRIRSQISTTLLLTQSKSDVPVRTHTFPIPFFNNPPWFTNSDLIAPQPTGTGDYTAAEGYTISSHLYPVTQVNSLMTHTTITFVAEQTSTPTPAHVSTDDEGAGKEGGTVASLAAASTTRVTATVTDTAEVAASSTTQVPASLSTHTTTRLPQPSRLITTTYKSSKTESATDSDLNPGISTLSSTTRRQHPTSTRTVSVQTSAEPDDANGLGLPTLEPRQTDVNYRTRTSIIRQTTTISQPNPYLAFTPPPIGPRQHVSGLNHQVAVAMQQPRPGGAKGPKIVTKGDEVVVYTTWTATVWKGPGITMQRPTLTTVLEVEQVQVTVEPPKPTDPILGDLKPSEAPSPDDRGILAQSDCQPWENCHNENVDYMQNLDRSRGPDLELARQQEGHASFHKEDYWNWQGSNDMPSGPAGGLWPGKAGPDGESSVL